jgi:hypothetical protein
MEAALRVAPALVQDDFEIIGQHTRLYANAMGLRDWEFEIMHGPSAPGCVATITVHDMRRYGQLRVCANFRALDSDVQRYALVHELVHPHLIEMDATVRDLQDELGVRLFAVAYSSYERAMERAVDALATVIAPTLPVISWA